MIRQFLANVEWGPLDYLIVDTPPGTSDEHLALLDVLAPPSSISTKNDDFGGESESRSESGSGGRTSALIVTTPQRVALADVEREIGFCRTVNLPMDGIIENMSGYSCPHCEASTRVFSSQGGRLLAEKHQLPLLAVLPITPAFAHLVEEEDACLLRDYPLRLPELHRQFQQVISTINQSIS